MNNLLTCIRNPILRYLMSTTQSHKVLVVDDEPDILELLQYNLIKEGYEVKTAPDWQKSFGSS
jgi:two-component system alkaline phosphatase synthesis response regulator PhoP